MLLEEEFEEQGRSSAKRALVFFLILTVLVSTLISKTLSANIKVGTGNPVEFGQGVAQTASCAGSTNLTLTPSGVFNNSGGTTGSFLFKSFTLSNIPVACQGKDFLVKAFGSTPGSTALAIFNSSSTDALFYNNGGTYQLGSGVTGATITTNSVSSVTFTFTTPVATGSSIFKFTVESLPHTGPAALLYNLGDTGPGGGKIFYTDINGFSCGPNLADRCNYLEAAPNTWSGSSPDPQLAWATSGLASTAIGSTAQGTAIGSGYKNSIAIVNQGNDLTTAAGAARNYTGGSKNDWYLPSLDEAATLSTNRSYVSSVVSDFYWTSSEYDSSYAYGVYLNTGQQTTTISKSTQAWRYVRPIRAF